MAGCWVCRRRRATSTPMSWSRCAGIWGPVIGAMVAMPPPLLPLAHSLRQDGPRARPGGDRRLRGGWRTSGRSSATRTTTCTSASTSTGWASGRTVTSHCPSTRPRCSRRAGAGDAARAALHAGAISRRHGSSRSASSRRSASRRSDEGINGVFSFTPDGCPLMGESRDVARLLGRRGGLGHPLGGGRAGDGRVARRGRAADRLPRV